MSALMSLEERLILLREPNSPIAESYRSLRAALSRSLAKGKRCFSIVSAWGGEGKSMVTANLAVSLSQLMMDVVIIDGDLRRPTLSRVFEQEGRPGVMELLEAGGDANKFVCDTSIERVFILPAGKSAVNPANLLGTGRFKSIIEALKCDDLAIVIDTSPVSACSDALLMAEHSDGAIMVVSPEKWQGEPEAHFAQDLEDHGVELLGAVMNNADHREMLPGSGYGNYGNYRQYGQGYGMYGAYGREGEEQTKPSSFVESLKSFFRKKR